MDSLPSPNEVLRATKKIFYSVPFFSFLTPYSSLWGLVKDTQKEGVYDFQEMYTEKFYVEEFISTNLNLSFFFSNISYTRELPLYDTKNNTNLMAIWNLTLPRGYIP